MLRMPLEERRRLLLEAAKRVIARGGLMAATTRAIAAEAEMPLASFHYVFESQAEMMRQLFASMSEDEAQMMAEVDTSKDGSARALIHRYLDIVVAEGGYHLGAAEFRSHALRTPSMRPLVAERAQRTRELIDENLSRWEAVNGTVVVRRDAFIDTVQVFMNGLVTQYLELGDEQRVRDLIDTVAPIIEDLARKSTRHDS